MSKATPDPPAAPSVSDLWVSIHVKVPRQWRDWLNEAAAARAMSVSDIVRQLIRGLMLERPRDGGSS